MDYEVKDLKKEDICIKDWEFEGQQRGEQPVLLSDFFCRAINKYFVKNITGEEKSYNYLFTHSNKLNKFTKESDFYFDELKNKASDKKFLKQLIKNTVELPREFNCQADKDMNKLKDSVNITNEELANYWLRLDEGFLKVIPWFWYPWFLAKEDILTNKVKEGLEKYRTQIEKITDFEEALLSVVFPTKKTAFQLEQEDMYELVSIFEDKEAFNKKSLEYLKKYDWLTTFILTPVFPMSHAQLMERVGRARKENFNETFIHQNKENKKKELVAERILDIVKNDKVLIDDIEDARGLAYGLTAGVEEAYMSTSKYLTLLQLVAQRMGIAFEDTKYFLSKEIFNTLKNGKSVNLKELEKRKKGFTMMMLAGQQYVAFGEEGHELSLLIDEELNKIDNSIMDLRGQIACKGKALGKVRVALQPSEAHKLEEGEILVCPMTNPDYVPAMRRSAAIITDEGGLLSHAAIMSSEFNKPCIIGTKIATKLLKTGYFVEVDANTGIVKILKKHG